MKLALTLILLIGLSACQETQQPTDHEPEIEELRLKLEATEAQLLNVRYELSKCKGEGAETDSIPNTDSK